MERYRKQVDTVVSENFEFILEKEQMIVWERNFDKIVYVYERVLANSIEIC